MNSDGPVQYRSELFRYAQRYVQPPEAAEDLVQEAYLRFGRGREPVAQPRPWLYTTVRNLALNFLRDQKPTVSWEVLENSSEGNDSASASEAPDQHLEHLQRLESIQQWLSTFPEREREIVRLKFEEDLSYREIGLRLQIKPSHVGYILSLAIKSLREMAGKEEL